MKNIILSIALFAALTLGAQSNPNPQNGYVDINKALLSMPGYSDSIKKLNAIRIMYQNQYNYLLVDLQQKIKNYESQKDSFSAFVANLKLQEIKKGQSNLDTFQAMANNALKMQQDQILSGFLKEIHDIVAEIGTQKHMGTIWDEAMLKNAIWTDPKSEITNDVIKAIQNKKAVLPNAVDNTKNKKNKEPKQ